MKKLFVLIPLFFSVNSWSQNSHKLSGSDKPENFEVSVQLKNNLVGPGFRNDVNANALRHFVENFEDAENISWLVSEDKTEVSFTLNKERITSYYDKHGDPVCIIKYYSENELDSTIARYVKDEAGEDYSIYLVTEFIQNNCSIFDVSLQNKKYWFRVKLLRTPDEGLEKLENKIFRKG